MTPPPPARYTDGIPDNLPAAANDALAWLRWLWGHAPRGWQQDSYVKLGACIARLEAELQPHLPAEFTETEPAGAE